MAKRYYPPHFSPPQFMTPPPGIYNFPVNITPTQANHQIYHEVNDLIHNSSSLAEVEAALTNDGNYDNV